MVNDFDGDDRDVVEQHTNITPAFLPEILLKGARLKFI
jgi:hypothetical protein